MCRLTSSHLGKGFSMGVKIRILLFFQINKFYRDSRNRMLNQIILSSRFYVNVKFSRIIFPTSYELYQSVKMHWRFSYHFEITVYLCNLAMFIIFLKNCRNQSITLNRPSNIFIILLLVWIFHTYLWNIIIDIFINFH